MMSTLSLSRFNISSPTMLYPTLQPQRTHHVLVLVLLVVVFVVLVLVLVVVVFVVVLVVLVVLVFVVVTVAETMLPASEQGKSNEVREAMFVQKYSELPLDPTSFVPVAVMSVQISLHTNVTTSLLFVPVPVTSM